MLLLKEGSKMNESSLAHKNEVPITIDHKHYKSPDPTTGSALYILGSVPSDYDLWKEVHGQGDDEVIPNNGTIIDLKPADKFYTAQRTLNPGAESY